MFDIGFQELVLIFVVALLVFGPKRLPEIGKSLGRGIAELKKAMHEMKETIREEERQIRKDMPDVKSKIDSLAESAAKTKSGKGSVDSTT